MNSEDLFARAKKVIPGGVNSPVRAFRAVGGTPLFLVRGEGCRVWDEDGREYLDFVGSWGPLILGHSHPAVLEAVSEALRDGLSFGAPTAREVEMAELLTEIVPHIDMVRMVNSGTEAVMSAVRVARGVTGRSKLIKFDGCYHGHSDAMLVGAGSGALTQGVPDSAGVTAGAAQDTLLAAYNDLSTVSALFEANPGQIAAVIVEPVAANMGVVPPAPAFLEGLRGLCDRYGALLIFDEVITGFRLDYHSAAGVFGVQPDLVCFGKIIGGGLPVGAYGGRRELMQQVSPLGPIYQGGTLSGNPLAMRAGIAALSRLRDDAAVYPTLIENTAYLQREIDRLIAKHQVPASTSRCLNMFCLFFTPQPVGSYADVMSCDTELYRRFFVGMLEQGIMLAPSQFEAWFPSLAHDKAILAETLAAVDKVFATL